MSDDSGVTNEELRVMLVRQQYRSILTIGFLGLAFAGIGSLITSMGNPVGLGISLGGLFVCYVCWLRLSAMQDKPLANRIIGRLGWSDGPKLPEVKK